MNRTFDGRLIRFKRLTRYFYEKVSEICWFISITTHPIASSSSSVDFLFVRFGGSGFVTWFRIAICLEKREKWTSKSQTNFQDIVTSLYLLLLLLTHTSLRPFFSIHCFPFECRNLATNPSTLLAPIWTLSPSCERLWRTMRVNSLDAVVTLISYSVCGIPKASESVSMSFISVIQLCDPNLYNLFSEHWTWRVTNTTWKKIIVYPRKEKKMTHSP